MKHLSKKNNFNLLTSSKQTGFTIVELLVVIVVIAILAAITVVSYTGISTKATVATIQSDLANNANILKMYYTTYSSYPTTLDGNKCASLPTPDTNYCLKSTSGIALSYQPSATTGTASDFALYASKNTTYYRTSSDSALTPQAITKTCPYGFIVVPGSSTYGTSDFCVMKYEAKQVGATTTPISTAAGTPWVSISQTTAITNSANVASCTGCHLISEAEWMTIAQNVLSVASNWSTGTVGSGYIYSGHNDNNPANALAASANDNDGYFGTNNTTGNQRRTLTLTNGEVIWDLAGNVYDWTAGTVQTPIVQPGITSAGYAWREWTAITNSGTLPISISPASTGLAGASTWNTTNGVGSIYSSSDEVGLRGFIRGGNWNYGSIAGVLSLYLLNGPGYTSTNFGFRVAAASGL